MWIGRRGKGSVYGNRANGIGAKATAGLDSAEIAETEVVISLKSA